MKCKVELSHRERVRLALQHKETDRVPVAMVCSGINEPARSNFDGYLRKNRGITLDEYLAPVIDIRNIGPDYVGPELPSGTDIWGVRRHRVNNDDGSYDEEFEFQPLADAGIDGIRAHPWPTTDMFDYGAMRQKIRDLRKNGDFCLMASNGNLFETSWYMMGFEQTLMNLLTEPEIVQSVLEKVTEFYIAHFRKILDVAEDEIDLVFTADDIGSQQGLLFSLETWERNIKPWHISLNKVIHEYGAKVIYHSDGSVAEAVPGLIDMGIDVLQALQFDAKGMDPFLLKEQYGDKLCFEGGISVQSTLPFGTPEKVREEVIERIRVLGRNGGYILGPSHVIQAGTPPENIAAMFDAAVEE